ncbi:hypothetical protein BKA70DRAFT_1244198 [Coprinopsis sp. MPI-PUGE-AT-0042]|nr:hypothetical protein BKA70DRAFT_1244198 [Coprinopsis sp. MPI-PUGE-AT-0042]
MAHGEERTAVIDSCTGTKLGVGLGSISGPNQPRLGSIAHGRDGVDGLLYRESEEYFTRDEWATSDGDGKKAEYTMGTALRGVRKPCASCLYQTSKLSSSSSNTSLPKPMLTEAESPPNLSCPLLHPLPLLRLVPQCPGTSMINAESNTASPIRDLYGDSTVLNDVNELGRIQPLSLQEHRLGQRSLQVQGPGERRLDKEREGYDDNWVTILIVKVAKGGYGADRVGDGKDDDQDLRAVNIVGLWPTPCVSLAAAATQRTGIVKPTH